MSDDQRVSAILDMLTELHGEVAGLRFEATDQEERLAIAETDLGALLPLVTRLLRENGELSNRLARLENRAEA